MLQLSYLGIAFSAVFYIVFGVAVRLMELTDKVRNKARLLILTASMSVFFISAFIAGVIQLRTRAWFYGVTLLILSFVALTIVASIFIELHNINARIRMRRFMVLFDIVERFNSEGKSREEIMLYLTEIQKLTSKEASDFMNFISEPGNHEFLSDVNAHIQNAKIMNRSSNDIYR